MSIYDPKKSSDIVSLFDNIGFIKNIPKYNTCDNKSHIIFQGKPYNILYDDHLQSCSNLYYTQNLGNKSIIYKQVYFNYSPGYYGIVIKSKNYNEWPFIYTLNESFHNIKTSYYTGDYIDSLKKLHSNINETYNYYNDNNKKINKINFDMIIIGCNINYNVVEYIKEIIKNFEFIQLDIKIRDMNNNEFIDNKMLIKYFITDTIEEQKSLIVTGLNSNNTIITKSIYL